MDMTRVALTLRTLAFGATLAAGALTFMPAALAAGNKTAQVTPTQTTATFGSWTVRCRPVTDGGTNKLCEMLQAVPAGNGGGVIVNLALGRLPGDKDLRMVVQLPLGVSLADDVDIALPGGDVAKATFQTCYPNLCVAQATVSDDLLAAFKAGDEVTIAFKDRTHKGVAVKASLSGFNDAYGSMTAGN
jgi:invasion protein IalB